jgi:hypothetical protein
MKNQKVLFLSTAERTKLVSIKDRFAFNEKIGWLWVQRLLFYILEKLGCQAYDEVLDVQRHIINPKSTVEHIAEQYAEALSLYAYKGEYLLIGPEQYAQFTHNVPLWDLYSFDGPYSTRNGEFKMKIVVIPWMDGILVVPRLS